VKQQNIYANCGGLSFVITRFPVACTSFEKVHRNFVVLAAFNTAAVFAAFTSDKAIYFITKRLPIAAATAYHSICN